VAVVAPEPTDKPLPVLIVIFVTASTPDTKKQIPSRASVITADMPL